MAPNIKEYNNKFDEKQKQISKEHAKLYSKAVSAVSSENLNTFSYMNVMMKVMDEIIRGQKKGLAEEEFFGGDMDGYIKKLCDGKPKKKPAETVCEALGILGWVFAAGFMAGALFIGKVMPLSVLSLVRWGILLVVGLVAIIYLQKKKMRSQMTLILIITMVYMAANNTFDIIFKNVEDFAVNVNPLILAAAFALLGFGANKAILREKSYTEWKRKK